MHNLGIHTGADLKQYAEADLVRHFGKVGRFYYLIARAEDNRIVEPNRERKSIGAETSFTKNLDEEQVMLLELENIAQTLQHRARKLSSSRADNHLESQVCRLSANQPQQNCNCCY